MGGGYEDVLSGMVMVVDEGRREWTWVGMFTVPYGNCGSSCLL